MSFPTTSILDNFNRADGALGANWATPFWNDAGTCAVTSSALNASAGAAAGWTAASFGPDIEAYMTPGGTVDTVFAVGIFSGTGSTPNGYIVRYTKSGTTLNMRRIDAGSSSSIKTATVQTVSAGDSIGLARRGTTIEMWYKASAGSWTLLDSVTDATYTPSGWLCGIEVSGAAGNSFDDFGGGTIAAAGVPIAIPAVPVEFIYLRKNT